MDKHSHVIIFGREDEGDAWQVDRASYYAMSDQFRTALERYVAVNRLVPFADLKAVAECERIDHATRLRVIGRAMDEAMHGNPRAARRMLRDAIPRQGFPGPETGRM